MQNSTQAANAWRILFLLFLANLFNFFDRTIPAIIIEPIRMEWHLSDFQLGIICHECGPHVIAAIWALERILHRR